MAAEQVLIAGIQLFNKTNNKSFVMMNFKYSYVAGVDEAGRGPLAGPVVAAAVILNPNNPISGLKDSKALSAGRREILAQEILEKVSSWSVAEATVAEIDRLNILQATMLAMQRAVEALSIRPEHVLIDGNRCPALPMTAEAVVKGDQLMPAISAASILAKVARDRLMLALDQQYPQYNFAKHKGYPTQEHIKALRQHGACPVHRRSFAPVRTVVIT